MYQLLQKNAHELWSTTIPISCCCIIIFSCCVTLTQIKIRHLYMTWVTQHSEQANLKLTQDTHQHIEQIQSMNIHFFVRGNTFPIAPCSLQLDQVIFRWCCFSFLNGWHTEQPSFCLSEPGENEINTTHLSCPAYQSTNTVHFTTVHTQQTLKRSRNARLHPQGISKRHEPSI